MQILADHSLSHTSSDRNCIAELSPCASRTVKEPTVISSWFLSHSFSRPTILSCFLLRVTPSHAANTNPPFETRDRELLGPTEPEVIGSFYLSGFSLSLFLPFSFFLLPFALGPPPLDTSHTSSKTLPFAASCLPFFCTLIYPDDEDSMVSKTVEAASHHPGTRAQLEE